MVAHGAEETKQRSTESWWHCNQEGEGGSNSASLRVRRATSAGRAGFLFRGLAFADGVLLEMGFPLLKLKSC